MAVTRRSWCLSAKKSSSLEQELGHKSSTLLFSKLISRIRRPLSGRELWSHQFKARCETYLLGKHSKKNTGLFGNLSQTSDPPHPLWEFRPFFTDFFGHVGKFWLILRWFNGVFRAMFKITIVLEMGRPLPPHVGKNSQIITYFFS